MTSPRRPEIQNAITSAGKRLVRAIDITRDFDEVDQRRRQIVNEAGREVGDLQPDLIVTVTKAKVERFIPTEVGALRHRE